MGGPRQARGDRSRDSQLSRASSISSPTAWLSEVATAGSLAGMDVINNEHASRYELHVGEEVAFLTYDRRGEVIIFLHMEVPSDLEGRGLAGQIAAKALTDAREQHLKVVPRCPYVASYIKRHPEFADLVAPSNPRAHA